MRNETDQSEIDILLAAYFAGEADGAERAQVETWKNASEANKKYFEASQKTWNASGELVSDKIFDTDAAWRKLKQKITDQPESAATAKRSYSWMAAAGVLLLIGVASVLWFMNDNGQSDWQKIVESGTTLRNDTLPDGSIVSLNRNSSIGYSSLFKGEIRGVELKGEAFFEVAHDAQHPFVIETGIMDVKVLGTSFNVRAYPGSDSVHVSVSTGKVQCVANGDTVIITPGEYAVYHKGAQTIRKGREDNPNRVAYRDRIFRFNNTTLGAAVQQMNEAYGCNIVLQNESLRSCTFTITKVFYNEPVENIIEAIEVIYPGITSRKEGNTIILEGTGCN